MTRAFCLIAVLSAVPACPEGAKRVEGAPQDADVTAAKSVCEKFLAALKKSDYAAASECMHPKSLKKIRETILSKMEDKRGIAKAFGFESVEALEKATDAEFFARMTESSLKNAAGGLNKAMKEGTARVVTANKAEEKVFIVTEMVLEIDGQKQTLNSLEILYKDGENWRLAHRLEMNIGK